MGKRDSQVVWDGRVHIATFKMNNRQRPTVHTAHGTLLGAVWQPGWEGSLRGGWTRVQV